MRSSLGSCSSISKFSRIGFSLVQLVVIFDYNFMVDMCPYDLSFVKGIPSRTRHDPPDLHLFWTSHSWRVPRSRRVNPPNIIQPRENTFGCKFFLWKEERVRLLVGSPGASTAPIYSPGSSSTPIYSPGSSTPPRYSPGASTPPSYSLGTSRNAECSNCKHLLDKITVLEATVDMYMHPEQHTVNSAALFHEVYNNMGKLDLE
ncbi:hypothetical protein Tco_1228580 [Tanacetum coccineum]